jgi:nitrogen fixation/metabolism regulation signal transduction histidine kinase
MATYKRRLIPIVDRRFQFKYTGLIFGVAAVVSLILGYFLLKAYNELNAMLEVSAAVNDKLNADSARNVFALVVGFLSAEVILIGVAGLLVTHRVVGPIFVLHRHVATLLEGKYPTLRPLRSGDEFVSTFEAFKQTVQMFQERDQRELDELKAVLEAAEAKGLEEDHTATLRRLVEEREARLESAEAS